LSVYLSDSCGQARPVSELWNPKSTCFASSSRAVACPCENIGDVKQTQAWQHTRLICSDRAVPSAQLPTTVQHMMLGRKHVML
jgi:hypothetical protein